MPKELHPFVKVTIETAEKAKAEAEKARLEAERVAAEKAKAEAEKARLEALRAEEKPLCEKEVKDRSVVLQHSGVDKISAIIAVRDTCAIGLGDAKRFVDSCPCVLKKGLTLTEAEEMKKIIEAVGAKIQIEQIAEPESAVEEPVVEEQVTEAEIADAEKATAEKAKAEAEKARLEALRAAEEAEPVKKEEAVAKKPSQPECKKESLFWRIVKKLFG